jgi:polyisoprenoid-binding protein YceI
MTRPLALLAAALSLAPAAAFAAEWVVDPSASSIAFSGTQLGAPFTGHFKRFTATVSFDPAHPEAGRAVVLIDTASAATGDVQRDEALPQAEWFDAKTNAQARFEATRFIARGGEAYDAVGTLTIRGVKHDVTLPFKLTIAGGKAHAVGHLQLIRTDFGVGQGDWATPQWVALEVGVDIDVTAHP